MARKKTRRARSTWIQYLPAGLIALALLVAACGGGSEGPGVASVGSSGSPQAGSERQGETGSGALAYSKCMREQGIKDFPDPDSNGNITIEARPGSDLDPNSAAYKAADEACKSLMPKPQATPAEDAAAVSAAMLKYAQCMRAHGIKDYPDPDSNGGANYNFESGSDMDPQSPQHRSADKVCAKLLPGGGWNQGQDDGAGGQ